MNKKILIVTIILIALSILALIRQNLFELVSNNRQHKENAIGDIKDQLRELRKKQLPRGQDFDAQLNSKLKSLALQISQLGNEEKFRNQLDLIARSLSDDEKFELMNIANNSQAQGDERLAAIYLLNLSQDADLLLSSIILEPLPVFSEQRRQEQEIAFRALAVEGIKNIALISAIENQTQSSFLIDRLERQKAYLAKRAPAPEAQDKKALEQLIQGQ